VLERETRSIRSLVLLAMALFLAAAPTPDPEVIAEMTSNLLVPEQNADLMEHFIEYLGRG